MGYGIIKKISFFVKDRKQAEKAWSYFKKHKGRFEELARTAGYKLDKFDLRTSKTIDFLGATFGFILTKEKDRVRRGLYLWFINPDFGKGTRLAESHAAGSVETINLIRLDENVLDQAREKLEFHFGETLRM